MKISGVLPIYNEERLLPYSLNGLENADIDELCIYLDRCTDNSQQIVENWLNVADPKFRVKIKIATSKPKWRNLRAYAFQQVSEMCRGNIIYTLGADVYYGNALAIFDEKYFEDYDLVSFYYRNYSLNTFKPYIFYIWFLEQIRGLKGHPFPFRRGALALTKELWTRVCGYRDTGYLEGPFAYEYDFINRVEESGAKTALVPSKLLHLRPDKNPYKEGLARADIGMPFYKTLIHGILQLKPLSIVGHLHYRKFGKASVKWK
jgi:glycosyltransferase involved in cell wall biosynthesis